MRNEEEGRRKESGLKGPPSVEVWQGLTPYAQDIEKQEEAVAALLAKGPERLIFCEHEPVLTLGSSAKAGDEGAHQALPTQITNRGGQVTYHGPGQRVIYPIVKLVRWNNDIRVYMRWLQEWLAAACLEMGVETEIRTGTELGLWVGNAKLAAFGVRVRKGVAFHGAALNISNDLSVYKTFTPCGIKGSHAISLQALNPSLTLEITDKALLKTLPLIWPKA